MNYYQIYSKVISNKKLSSTMWETILEAPEIAKSCKPGQFINILPSYNWDNVMRRPMSIAGSNKKQIKLLYKIIGDGTDEMSRWIKGDIIDMIGPLGNQFNNYYNVLPILIGGGTGTAPLLYLHDVLKINNINHILIIGAKTKQEHFIKHDPDKNIFITTDNGSYGIKGNVITALNHIFLKNKNKKMKVFACGPNIMMKSIQDFTNNNSLPCELSLECVMACGIGICQGCTITMKNHNNKKDTYREKYQLLCIDGPVMNSKEVTFAEK